MSPLAHSTEGTVEKIVSLTAPVRASCGAADDLDASDEKQQNNTRALPSSLTAVTAVFTPSDAVFASAAGNPVPASAGTVGAVRGPPDSDDTGYVIPKKTGVAPEPVSIEGSWSRVADAAAPGPLPPQGSGGDVGMLPCPP